MVLHQAVKDFIAAAQGKLGDLCIIRSSMTFCHSKVRTDSSLLQAATPLSSLHTLHSSMSYSPLIVCPMRVFLSRTRMLFKSTCLSMSAPSCSITPRIRWLRKVYAQRLRREEY